MLELVNGKMVLQIDLGGMSYSRMETNNSFSNGSWVRVVVQRTSTTGTSTTVPNRDQSDPNHLTQSSQARNGLISGKGHLHVTSEMSHSDLSLRKVSIW